MNHQEKTEKLKQIQNEKDFRIFLIDLLKRMGFKNVRHTHMYGNVELGKDIIASLDQQFEEKDWYAFIVKHGRIIGNTDIIENIKNQIKQSFEYPYENIDGNKLKINKVRILTNEHITEGAITSIRESSSLNIYSNYEFWWNERLIEYIDNVLVQRKMEF